MKVGAFCFFPPSFLIAPSFFCEDRGLATKQNVTVSESVRQLMETTPLINCIFFFGKTKKIEGAVNASMRIQILLTAGGQPAAAAAQPPPRTLS